MKKTLLYTSLFIVVIAAVAVLIIKGQSDGTLKDAEKDFSIADTAVVGKIYMADRNDQKVVLERQKDNTWLVNNSYKARQAEVQELLTTLRAVRAINPVAKSMHNNIVKSMAASNTVVEIYDRKGKMIKSYYVGGPTLSDQGNYMRLKDADQLFEVNIPGFRGHLTSRYFLDEVDWRDRQVFAYDHGSISSVKVEYPRQPQHSFDVRVVSRDSFLVQPLQQEYALRRNVDKREVNTFLSHFQLLNAEAYANDHPAKDTTMSTIPFAVITVTDKAGNENKVDIFYKAKTQRTKLQYDNEGNEMNYDADRYFAVINGGKDLVIIQQFVFGKVLRKYEDLLERTKLKV